MAKVDEPASAGKGDVLERFTASLRERFNARPTPEQIAAAERMALRAVLSEPCGVRKCGAAAGEACRGGKGFHAARMAAAAARMAEGDAT